jgi:hypothetical protein
MGPWHLGKEVLVSKENSDGLVTDNGMLSVATDACHFVWIETQANRLIDRHATLSYSRTVKGCAQASVVCQVSNWY